MGFIVGKGHVSPDPDKIESIRNFPRPETKKDVRKFTGFLNFYRRFIPHLATVCAPLNETLKQFCPNKIVWTDELNRTYEAIKSIFLDFIILKIPQQNVPFIVQTDASDKGLGAILWQNIDGLDRPISCLLPHDQFSRKLTDPELKYSTIEKECLAIVWAVTKFHDYLYGRQFTVRTDHAPLQWLNQNSNKVGRRMRWSLLLSIYMFNIEYVKGKDNVFADILSRYPVDPEFLRSQKL